MQAFVDLVDQLVLRLKKKHNLHIKRKLSLGEHDRRNKSYGNSRIPLSHYFSQEAIAPPAAGHAAYKCNVTC